MTLQERLLALVDSLGSWRLWLLVAGVMIVTPFVSIVPSSVGFGATLVGGVLAAAAMLTVAWLGWVLVLRHLSGAARLIAAPGIILLAAAARGAVLQQSLQAGEKAGFWILASCSTVSIAVIIGTLVKEGIDGHRNRLEKLVTEQRRLADVLAQAEQDLRLQQADAVSVVSTVVVAQFADVTDSTALLAADTLEQLASEVVRPLSHELAAAAPVWEPPAPPQGRPRLDWSRVWGTVADTDLLDAWGPALVMLLITPASMLIGGFWRGLALHLLAATVIVLGLSLVRRLSGLARGRRTPIRLLVSYALLVLGCIPAALVAIAFPEPPSNADEVVWVLIILPLVALLLSVVRAARMQQRTLEQETAAASRQTRWWISRTRMVLWWWRSLLARALHGRVQSTIHAAVHRLRLAEQQGNATTELVRSELAAVRRALPGVVMPADASRDVPAGLAALVATWRPIADVTCDLSDDAASRLGEDPICGDIALDAVMEAVSNAVRHGGAQQVEVAIGSPDEGVLSITVSDDGRGRMSRPDDHQDGLGTGMLDACALQWGFEDEAGRHVVWLELPWLSGDAAIGSVANEPARSS